MHTCEGATFFGRLLLYSSAITKLAVVPCDRETLDFRRDVVCLFSFILLHLFGMEEGYYSR